MTSHALFTLAHAALGWVLLEAFLAAAAAGPLLHAISTASTLCPAGLALLGHPD